MKYETPELTAIHAIELIQQTIHGKSSRYPLVESAHPGERNEMVVGYADWE